MHERLSGLFGRGARAEGPAANGHAADAQSAGDDAGGGVAELERRARELEQRAVDLDEALRQATADLAAARRHPATPGGVPIPGGEGPGSHDEPADGHGPAGSRPSTDAAGNPGEHGERVRDLEAVVGRLHEEADACHARALAARLQADDAAAGRDGGGGDGEDGGGRGPASELPVTRWNQPGAEWTELLEAVIDERPGTAPSGTDGPPPTDARRRAPGDAGEPGAVHDDGADPGGSSAPSAG